jgi:PAS domain S-box-containing protein
VSNADLTPEQASIRSDPDLVDQAEMCAAMLLTLADRWRLRAVSGHLGPHSVEASLEFAAILESGAAALQHQRPREFQPADSLEESEERFRLLVESVKDYAIFMLDAEGRVTSWNAGAQRIKGYAADEIIGKHFSVFYTPEAVEARHPDSELRIATREGRYEEEGWRVRNDGSRFYASVVITALRDRSGRLVGFAKVTRDITERRDAERVLLTAKIDLERRVEERTRDLVAINEKLEDAYAEAQRAVRMREEVLAVVSHDLRNPLAAIHAASAVLLLKPGGDPQVRKHVETIHRSASRMDHLLADLLDMASLQAGRLPLERRAEDPIALADEVFEIHEPLALEKGLKLTRELDFHGAQLLCDRDRVLQVFGNLVGNAIKLCRSGDTVTIRGEVIGGEARFSIRDTGAGIPAADLPHIFEPYWSAERHAKKGTGLGLYISKGIVETHGGRLWVESRFGEGATFYFSLPLADRQD